MKSGKSVKDTKRKDTKVHTAIPASREQSRQANQKHDTDRVPSVKGSNQNPNPINEFLLGAIQEFLIKQGFQTTVETLQDEQPIAMAKAKQDANSNEAVLMEAFDKGNREAFFTRWKKFLPPGAKGDEEVKKLEFYLHVYFLVFAIHPNLKKGPALDKNEVEHFKVYLDNNGADLSKTTECLQFYALPYMTKPQENPALKPLFTKEWPMEMRKRLVEVIKKVNGGQDNPILLQMYNVYVKGGGANNTSPQSSPESPSKDLSYYMNYVNQMEANNKELMHIVEEFNIKCTNLQKNNNILSKKEELAKVNLIDSQTKWSAFSKELVGISKSLLSVLEKTDYLQKDPTAHANVESLKTRVQKYDQFLSTNIEDLVAVSQDYSVFDKQSMWQEEGQQDLSVSPIGTQNVKKEPVLTYPPLDYQKLVDHFVSSKNENYQRAILQALRWRITRTYGVNIRRAVILAFNHQDILGLRSDRSPMLDCIFVKGGPALKESAARFSNALSSDYLGRSYLVESNKFLVFLIGAMKKEVQDSCLRRNCLGTVQKLSLRRSTQLIMIQNDMINWTISILKQEMNTISEYSFEYATALLMNLSLRTAGKIKCEEQAKEVLSVLATLLEHPNIQVRTFVNGTLYSLLARPKLRDTAIAMKMNERLVVLLENSEERLKRQIQYIINQLTEEKSPEEDALSDTNEDENDVDDADEDDELGEDDEEDETIQYPNGIGGEELLLKEFNINPMDGLKQSTLIHNMLEQSRSQLTTNRSQIQNKNVMLRPATPNLHVNAANNNPSFIQGDNNLPSEMKSKPKILRTPVNLSPNMRGEFFKFPIQEEEKVQHLTNIPDPNMVIKRQIEQQSEDYKKAFEVKQKIPRTPPVQQQPYQLKKNI